MPDEDEPTLGPVELHSLNKSLICLELQREWRVLSRAGSLAGLGAPFDSNKDCDKPQILGRNLRSTPSRLSFIKNLSRSPSPSNLSSQPNKENDSAYNKKFQIKKHEKQLVLPLLKLIFQKVFASLPILRDSQNIWLKIGSFVDDFNHRNFSSSREKRQLSKRAVISIGYTRVLFSFVASILRFDEGHSKPSRPAAEDFMLIDKLPKLLWNYGTQIKVLKDEVDGDYLILLREKIDLELLKSTIDNSEEFYSPVLLSSVDWDQFSEFLATLDHPDPLDLGLTQSEPGSKSIEEAMNNLIRSTHKEQLFDWLMIHQISSDLKEGKLQYFLKRQEKCEEDWIRVGKRTKMIRDGYKEFVRRLIYEDGEVDRIYALMRQNAEFEDALKADPVYEHAQNWAIVWLSYVLHFVFISGPNSDEICDLLIRLNSLIPYGLIRQGLKIVNPALAIKSVTKLILGQPLGSLSLFQRMFELVMKHQIKSFEKQIHSILDLEDDVVEDSNFPKKTELYEAIKDYVYLSAEEKQRSWDEFESSPEDIILLILQRSSRFSDEQILAIKNSEQEFKRNFESTPLSILFKNLCMFLRLLCQKRDREQILDILLEPDSSIIQVIRSFLDLFYPTIKEVALASDLSKKLAHTEAFVAELIQVIHNRKKEEVHSEVFVQLLDRHKQSYWSFLHDLVKYQDLCLPIKEWIRSSLDLMKNGVRRSKESTTSPDSERIEINLEQIISREPGTDIIEEAKALSRYDRYTKGMNEIYCRLQFCKGISTNLIRKDLVYEMIQILAVKDREGFGSIIYQPIDDNENLTLGWAWWVDEQRICGEGYSKMNELLQEKSASHNMDNDILLEPKLEIRLNSDLARIKTVVKSYLDQLTKLSQFF